MSLTDAGEVLAMEAVYPPLTTRYVGLFTTAPADDGTGGVEVSGGSYARVGAQFTVTDGDPTYAENDGDIDFPQATAGWGAVTHAGAWTAVSGGTLIDVFLLVDPTDPNTPLPRIVANGDQVSIPAGLLVSELT